MTYYSARELAERLGVTRVLLLRRAREEEWTFKLDVRTKRFQIKDLPGDIRKALREGKFLWELEAAKRKELRAASGFKRSVEAMEKELETLRKRIKLLERRIKEAKQA